MMNETNSDKLSRRRMIVTGAAALAGGAVLAHDAFAQPTQPTTRGGDEAFEFEEKNPSRDNAPQPQTPLPPGEPGRDYTPVIVPNGWRLPYKVVDGVKVFHLVAEEVRDHEFVP